MTSRKSLMTLRKSLMTSRKSSMTSRKSLMTSRKSLMTSSKSSMTPSDSLLRRRGPVHHPPRLHAARHLRDREVRAGAHLFENWTLLLPRRQDDPQRCGAQHWLGQRHPPHVQRLHPHLGGDAPLDVQRRRAGKQRGRVPVVAHAEDGQVEVLDILCAPLLFEGARRRRRIAELRPEPQQPRRVQRGLR